MKELARPVEIRKYANGEINSASDLVAREEPLEIRLKYFDGSAFSEKRLAVTMRTPGNDFELAIGFLLTEGIISEYDAVQKIFYCEDIKAVEEEGNVVIVHLQKEVVLSESIFNRNFYINSSCGVCGKSSLESVRTSCKISFHANRPIVSRDLILSIPEKARAAQTVFKHTGGLHASALFNTKGELELIREDIGRHNALDKIAGARSIEGKDNSESILFISGRAGFELAQKSLMAGIPVIIAVGAPSSLAVEMSKSFGQTLIGFARGERFNVYSGVERILD